MYKTQIEASALYAEIKRLHDEEGMDFLLNLTGEDWLEDGIGVVYQVENTENHKQACVKCVVADRENPMIPSVSDLWDIANVYEREVYDYYGIIFTNHPDMRRLFLRTDFNGYPLRKDFDMSPEANQFPLTDEPESDYTVVYSLDADDHLVATKKRLFADTAFVVNIGPNNPSSHGVLPLQTVLDVEKVNRL